MLVTLFAFLTRIFHLILGISTPQNFPPPLAAEEEQDCFLRAEAGDEDARQKLILHNLRLVSHIVRKYYASARNSEDLVSIGTIGLVKAVDTYKVSSGTRFATYAGKCIQNEILMHFRAQKKFSSEVSLSETIDVDRDGNPLTYIDVICSDEDIAEEVDRKMKTEQMMLCIERCLSAREKQIVVMRYGLGGTPAQTQREIAERLGISRSYVSRIEKSALSKLRDGMA